MIFGSFSQRNIFLKPVFVLHVDEPLVDEFVDCLKRNPIGLCQDSIEEGDIILVYNPLTEEDISPDVPYEATKRVVDVIAMPPSFCLQRKPHAV